MNRALVIAVLLIASAAARGEADVWQRALDPKASDELASTVYEREMRDGDDQVTLAAGRSISLRVMREHVQSALTAYNNAAIARPTRAEPYFRIGDLIHSFYLDNCIDQPHLNIAPSPLRDCSRADVLDLHMAEAALDAWDAAETREPLHPRFTADFGGAFLFRRAVLHTRLATKAHLQKALLDYQRILSRADPTEPSRLDDIWGNVWTNLAETQMMLGDLDTALTSYREAWQYTKIASIAYGFAVALDRGSRGQAALSTIIAQGEDSYEAFNQSISRGDTFYVPRGEIHYYRALIEEAWGREERAIEYWREYIASGAHPEFQPRAQAHLDALIAKRRAAGRPVPRNPFMDLR
jgi:tetratricopeptide (TPR) repeat protein